MNTQNGKLTNDIYKLEVLNYLASDHAVALMAKDYSEARATSEHIRGAYLKVLVAHSQTALPNAVVATADHMREAVKITHDRLYAIVLTAILTPDTVMDESQPEDERKRRSLERNRRSNFARSAKSTLMAFINAGGALQGLKPAEATKESLRQATQTQTQVLTDEARASAIETRLERTVRLMAEHNREAAIDFIDRLHTKLMLLVAQPLTQLTTRRGELTLHPSH